MLRHASDRSVLGVLGEKYYLNAAFSHTSTEVIMATPSKKARHWCGTSYKYLSFRKDIEDLKEHKFSYLVFQKEKCPTTGRDHIQFYVEFPNTVTMTAVKNAICDPAAHLETRKGDREQVCCDSCTSACSRDATLTSCCRHFLFPYE